MAKRKTSKCDYCKESFKKHKIIKVSFGEIAICKSGDEMNVAIFQELAERKHDGKIYWYQSWWDTC